MAVAAGKMLREVTMPGKREQAIRERAYAIWEQEGRPDGKDLDHWLRAEAEIIAATAQQASPSLTAKN
jgi:Protein of unknown function (DUF2934)